MFNKQKVTVEVEVPAESLHVEHATCPNGHSLLDEEVKINNLPSLKVKVRYKDQEGFLHIDPVFGSYDNIEKGISMPKGSVSEFFCPTCDVNLKDVEDTCQLCSSPMFVIQLPKGSIVEGCTKKGCIFHKLKIVDAEQQIGRLFENSTLESFL